MKVQSKKLNPPFSIKTNGREDAKQVIEFLVEIGFKANEFWNREQLKEKFYDQHLDKGFVNVNSENVIELHTHSCDNDVISRKHLLKEIPKPEYDPKEVALKQYDYIKEIISPFNGSIEDWNSKFNEPKIIGYKLIKPQYKEAVREILKNGDSSWFDNFDSNLIESGYNFVFCDVLNSVHNQLETAGVMHWFSPVYDTSITLKSGVKLSEDDIAEVKELIRIRQVCKDLSK